MAQITLNIPDQHVDRVVAAVSNHFGYTDEIDGQPNTETRAAYSRRKIAQWLKFLVLEHEQEIARQAAGSGIDEIDITA